MADTKIEWADAVWNPIAGCSVVSPGCTNCYAMAMAARIERMGGAPHYAGLTRQTKAGAVWTGKVAVAPDATFTAPLRWKKPKRIFVNSMSDLFHEGVPDAVIDRVFAVMALAPQHTFLVLTKRAERMRMYCSTDAKVLAQRWSVAFKPNIIRMTWHEIEGRLSPFASSEHRSLYRADALRLPLENVWLGVSVEDQARADERIPHLLATPAAVRWISAEPLLGPVDLTRLPMFRHGETEPCFYFDMLRAEPRSLIASAPGVPQARALDWVVVGGESGPKARPMHPDWARSLRDQCAAAAVPFFFKQWGTWMVTYDRDRDDPDWKHCGEVERAYPNGRWLNHAGGHGFHGDRVCRVIRDHKTNTGRALDGRIHDAYPTRTLS